MTDEYTFTIRPPTKCPKCGSNNITIKWVNKGKWHGAYLRCESCRITYALPLLENAGKRTTHAALKWRENVIKRSGGKCANCGSTNRLEVHHIVPVCEDPENATNENNGICLCHECHMKAHSSRANKLKGVSNESSN